jgi:hypothetical protein
MLSPLSDRQAGFGRGVHEPLTFFLSQQLAELLELIRPYGPEPVADAIEKAAVAL